MVVILLLFPLIAFLVELALLPAAVLLALKPWAVEATTAGPPAEYRKWRVRGWRASKRAIEEVAGELAAGVPAEPEDAESE